MKTKLITLLSCVIGLSSYAQPVFMTRSGQVSFYSRTPMENIDAVNNEVNSLLNVETGEIVFAVLVKSFRFEKALMEEHFNENYMESARIPKSTFQGKIRNVSAIDFRKDGDYPAVVEGDLTIHGVKRHIETSGSIKVSQGKINVLAALQVKLADYDIERPALVAEKIAETIEIKIDCRYDPKS